MKKKKINRKITKKEKLTFKNIINKFTYFEWGMVLAVVGFTIYFSIIDTTNTILYLIIDAIAAISGILCVVLCAKGKKSQYIWGVLNVVGYVIIAWINKYYGEVMLNALYYLPSQFIGYYLWNKHTNEETDDVEGNKLNITKSILLVIVCGVGILLYKILLDALGGQGTLLDSASTTISVFANLLMMLRYREQWLLWIIIDIITVIMWILAGDLIMVTMWSVYLINAFYGYYNWTKISKER
ncbi:MAG: nicotinamide mononucleotide transporter [Firmicutes bacterium]|nr:nicotinamide mononucleotide transporter [Bacillota bacterium]